MHNIINYSEIHHNENTTQNEYIYNHEDITQNTVNDKTNNETKKTNSRDIRSNIYHSNEDGKYNNTYRISKHINHRCNHSRDYNRKKERKQ